MRVLAILSAGATPIWRLQMPKHYIHILYKGSFLFDSPLYNDHRGIDITLGMLHLVCKLKTRVSNGDINLKYYKNITML